MINSCLTGKKYCTLIYSGSFPSLLPDANFYCEPGVADVLDVEEGVMRVGAVLVEGPHADISPSDGDVPDHGNPHVRVSLQAEGEDGDADEEY